MCFKGKEVGWSYEYSQPNPGDMPPPARLHSLPKQRHPLGTKCSTSSAYRDILTQAYMHETGKQSHKEEQQHLELFLLRMFELHQCPLPSCTETQQRTLSSV